MGCGRKGSEKANIEQEQLKMQIPSNGQARIARGAFAAMLLFIFGIFAPVKLFGIDGMEGGFALGMISLFFAIVAAVTWLVFLRRAKVLDAFLQGRGILARWDVPPEVWSRHIAADLVEEKRDKRRLFLIVVAWMVVIGAGFLIKDFEAGLWVLAILLGVLAILALLAFWYPTHRARRLLRRSTPVIIGKTGAYVGGELHDWRLIGSFLGDVELEEGPDPKLLRICYFYVSGQGVPIPVEFRIPVPPGKEAEAARVTEELKDLRKKKGEDT
jgi:hypothetical protein